MFIFPVHLFNPAIIKAAPTPQTISGGESLAGDEDIIATDGGGRWAVQFADIQLNTPEKLRAWNAWLAYLDGGAAAVLVPLVSLVTAPRPGFGRGPLRPPPIYADDPVWPTVVRFTNPYIVAGIGADAAMRATSVEIDLSQGAGPVGGDFSIGERAYRIVRETATGVFSIRPPLRAAIEAGDVANFDWPVVKCRLQQADDPAIMFSRNAPVGISFLEITR